MYKIQEDNRGISLIQQCKVDMYVWGESQLNEQKEQAHAVFIGFYQGRGKLLFIFSLFIGLEVSNQVGLNFRFSRIYKEGELRPRCNVSKSVGRKGRYSNRLFLRSRVVLLVNRKNRRDIQENRQVETDLFTVFSINTTLYSK